MQQDCLIPTLTVRETLQYSADLRLAEVPGKKQRQEIVERVIRDLGLKECVSTRIGDGSKKGCSGGELIWEISWLMLTFSLRGDAEDKYWRPGLLSRATTMSVRSSDQYSFFPTHQCSMPMNRRLD
jgi:hypothetical protein